MQRWTFSHFQFVSHLDVLLIIVKLSNFWPKIICQKKDSLDSATWKELSGTRKGIAPSRPLTASWIDRSAISKFIRACKSKLNSEGYEILIGHTIRIVNGTRVVDEAHRLDGIVSWLYGSNSCTEIEYMYAYYLVILAYFLEKLQFVLAGVFSFEKILPFRSALVLNYRLSAIKSLRAWDFNESIKLLWPELSDK